jgi:membrane protein implicated in regulation of membrane protease activity
MILLGLVLLIIGFIAAMPFIWMLGLIAVVIGAVLAISGRAGHQLAGRSHWY